MERVTSGRTRPNHEQLLEREGLVYNFAEQPDGSRTPYWSEGVYYAFAEDEVAGLERDVATMFEMCVAAGDHIVAEGLMGRLGIPDWAHEDVARTWEEEPPSVYARFDVRYGGRSRLVDEDPSLATPQLLEFNADTPTSLVESAVCQWSWFDALRQGRDQWNSIHERLIEAWRRNLALVEQRLGRRPFVHVAYTSAEESGEDAMNATYMMDTAHQAGYEVAGLVVEDIAWDASDGRFYDPQGRHIEVIFKLYPWEWMLAEEFGKRCVLDMSTPDGTVWVEPIYKMLWSNKGILPVLWKLFGDDPERGRLLLPAYFEDERPADLKDYVRKPLLGREGASVEIVRGGQVVDRRPGEYGAEGYVCQALAPLPNFRGPDGDHHPVLGPWLVDGEPAGLGIRESSSLITDNGSMFVPHVIG